MNGDTHLNIDLDKLLSFHNKYNSLATIVVTYATNPKEQELVIVENNDIKEFYKREDPKHFFYLEKNPHPLMNAGVYVLNKEILKRIPANANISLEKEIFSDIKREIKVFFYGGYIRDIGDLDSLKEFNKDVLEGRI